MFNKMNLILGTMQFGERLFGQDAYDMIDVFGKAGFSELDTAFVYNDGESEELIGQYLNKTDMKFKIATKANPRITGKLDKEAVLSQTYESLNRLDAEYVDLLYLHFPDPNTPVEYALEACAKLYDEGKIGELGLSNFPAWLVAEAVNICEKNNWIKPTVYEGLYNPLSRKAENELNMALNYYKMRYYAYNPLAGGLLTDKYSDKTVKEGRFVNRPNYKKRYWHESYFESIQNIEKISKKYNINITEASFRWLAYHSMLSTDRGDGIIVGASSVKQLRDNIEYIKNGELPKEIIVAFDEAWANCKLDAPEYFTFYKPTK